MPALSIAAPTLEPPAMLAADPPVPRPFDAITMMAARAMAIAAIAAATPGRRTIASAPLLVGRSRLALPAAAAGACSAS